MKLSLIRNATFVGLSLLLSGCMTTTDAPQQPDGAVPSQFALDYPERAKLGAPQLQDWVRTMVGKRSLTARALSNCGPSRTPLPGASLRQKISQAERDIQDLPSRSACWLETAQNALNQRGIEIAYVKEISRGLGGSPIETTDGRMLDIYVPPLETELENFQTVYYRQFFEWGEGALREDLRNYRGTQRAERESWSRATASAVRDFAGDNPFTRPNPGLSNIATTSSLVINATPTERLAMNNMDRTLFGEQAFAVALERQIRAQTPRLPPESSSATGSLITLQQGRYCAGDVPGNDCATEAEYISYHNGLEADDRRNRMAQYAQQAAISREQARVQAAQSRQRLAAACGFSTYDEYRAANVNSCQ